MAYGQDAGTGTQQESLGGAPGPYLPALTPAITNMGMQGVDGMAPDMQLQLAQYGQQQNMIGQ